MATNRQSYLGGRIRPSTSQSPLMSFTGSEWANRNAWDQMPETPDRQVMDLTFQRSKLAHDALMRANAMEAEEDNAILSTATPDEFANLFGTPRTEREARLQRIVQKDVTAKERGVRLIGTPKERVDYQQSLANLSRTNLANYLDPMRFGLDEARFMETMSQNDRNFMNQQAQRQHAMNQLASQNQFRGVQAQNAAANLAQRQQFQQANLGQRERFHGDTQANQTISQMMAMERMLQDNAEAAQRQQNYEADFNRDYFGSVAGAADRGALRPDQLSQFAGMFDPQTMAILQGYANLGAQNAPETSQSTSTSPGYLSRIAQFFGGGSPAAPVADQWPDDYGDDGADEFGMGSDFAPPPAMAARPTAPAPQPQQRRQQFIPGSTVRDPRTGRQFLVLPNGQFRPI